MSKLIFGLNKLKISSKKRVLNIENVEFELNSNGNTIALIGESGIGKSTIFKSLFKTYIKYWYTEYDVQFECKHIINGKEYSDIDIKTGNDRPNFGFATQVPYFDNSKSAEENLFLPLKWSKKKWSKEEKDRFIDIFQLGEFINGKMPELSGGQRQILNIARVLLSNPELVIIDECFSNLNEKLAEEYINILRNYYGSCIFIITSHRTTDISCFNAQVVKIGRKTHMNGVQYVTIL